MTQNSILLHGVLLATILAAFTCFLSMKFLLFISQGPSHHAFNLTLLLSAITPPPHPHSCRASATQGTTGSCPDTASDSFSRSEVGTTVLLRDHVTLTSASLLKVTTHSLLGWEWGGFCVSRDVGGGYGNSWILSWAARRLSRISEHRTSLHSGNGTIDQ